MESWLTVEDLAVTSEEAPALHPAVMLEGAVLIWSHPVCSWRLDGNDALSPERR